MAYEKEFIEELFMELDDRLERNVNALKGEYSIIRAGRANPHVLDRVLVDYYGQMSPINQVGNISVLDARCLTISPWDASMLKVIEKAILSANIGLTPLNDGKIIRLVFPEVTEDRRRELVKQVKKIAEDSKVSARNIRRDSMDALKKYKNNKEISEDEFSTFEKDVEDAISKSIQLIEKTCESKEKDLLSV